MIWLASFPRSGNTFTRNIFKEVFGIDSGYDDEPGWREFPIVKTHFLPKQISDLGEKDTVIYLVRDGRDCICSLAHHMKDIAGTGDHLIQNMVESTVAAEGSYFGGWSTHVLEWLRRADVVIRYEDLIENPQKAFQRISEVMDLPEGDWSRLPSFEKLKKDANPYGIVKEEWKKDPDIAGKFYRKGRSGTWKEEMPPRVEALFRSIHGTVLKEIGYSEDGTIIAEAEFQHTWQATIETGKASGDFRVLIEAQKLADVHHDGVFRYVHSLIMGMRRQQRIYKAFPCLKIDLLINGQIRPLFSEVEEFVPDQKHWVVQMKEKLWTLYEWFPTPIKRLSVSTVNFYFYLKSRFYLWLNRKHFAAYDLLHFTLPQNYYVFQFVQEARFLCTVHDLTHRLFPQHHLKRNIKNAENGLDFIQKKKASIIAVSEATAKDFQEAFPNHGGTVRKIYEAADREVFNKIYDRKRIDPVLERYGLQFQKYFFSLATLEPRKNLKNTLAAFVKFKAQFPDSGIHFVAGGKLGWKEKLGYADRNDIVHLGYVKEADLPIFYSGALAFTYVSHYEGFGLPLLEAMRCQTPVIYGDNSSMKELVGDHGQAVHADSTDEISDAMKAYYADHAFREQMAEKGFYRALEFSWDQAALETMDYYAWLTGGELKE